jgi:hypothetical protein
VRCSFDLLPSIIALYSTLLSVCILIFTISSDTLAIVVTLIGIGVAILFQLRNELNNQTNELRNQTNKFVQTDTKMNKMNSFLMQTTLSQIDEKVSMLRNYALNAKDWKNMENGVTTMTDRVVADITTIIRVREYVTDDQKIKLNEALRHLTKSMSTNNYDIGRIEDVSKLLNSY